MSNHVVIDYFLSISDLIFNFIDSLVWNDLWFASFKYEIDVVQIISHKVQIVILIRLSVWQFVQCCVI